MVYKLIENENGDYINKSDVRFTLLEAKEAFTPEGLNVGWEYFRTKEDCLGKYELRYEPLPETQELEEGKGN